VVALADVLSLLAPNDEETSLLRACVNGDATALHDWARVPTLEPAVRHSRQVLAASLYRAVRRNEALSTSAFGSHLRAAVVVEEARWREYAHISSATLTSLLRAGITPAVIRGAALAETVYPDAASRHCDSIVLLVRPWDLDEAVTQLGSIGFVPHARAAPEEMPLKHRGGLRLALRTELLVSSMFRVPAEDIWDRSVAARVTGVPVRRLSSADALLEICMDGLVSRRLRGADWALDAWHVAVRGSDLRWDVLADSACRAGAALPVLVGLTYLAQALNAPVPSATLAALRAAARRASADVREACLYATQRHPGLSPIRLAAACRSWHSRALVLKWLLCPTAVARAYEPPLRGLPLSLAYARRLARIVSSRIRRGSRAFARTATGKRSAPRGAASSGTR
jgi:hypothetical protein